MSRIEMNTVADRAGVRIVTSPPAITLRQTSQTAPVPKRHARWRGPNLRGEWRCSGKYGCGRWLPGHAFPWWEARKQPTSSCADCRAAYRKLAQRHPDHLARERARQVAFQRRRRRDRTTETRWRIGRVRELIAAMLATGWTVAGIARAAGTKSKHVKRWRDGTAVYIHRATYRKVETLAGGGVTDHHEP